MRTQTEADSAFLELVQGSLQASAKEAERLARSTGTRLIRIESTQPVVPKELLPLLSAGNTPNSEASKAVPLMADSTGNSHLSDIQEEIIGRMLGILIREIHQRPGQQISTDIAINVCIAKIDKPLAKAAGGKEALLVLAGKAIDDWLEAGIFVQAETAKKVMLRLGARS